MFPDNTVDQLRRDDEFYAGILAGSMGGPVESYADAGFLCGYGIDSALRGFADHSQRFLKLALHSFLHDVGPDGPAEIEAHFEPSSAAELAADIPPSAAGGVETIGGSCVVPFDARTKSEWWTGIALCRWFLENRHDAVSYSKASDELDRYFVTHPKELADREWQDDQARTFHMAGDDARLMQYFARPGAKFKAPERPRLVRSERKMAWVLSNHRLNGSWTRDQLEQAWESFLPASLRKLADCGHDLAAAAWIKRRFWDDVEPRPEPYETFLRIYDYVPDVPRPPLRR
jgi:hypothetical protein